MYSIFLCCEELQKPARRANGRPGSWPQHAPEILNWQDLALFQLQGDSHTASSHDEGSQANNLIEKGIFSGKREVRLWESRK